MRKYPKSKRFDSDETTDLINYYQGKEVSGKFPWIKYLSKDQAKEEIIARFNNFIHTLLTPCMTGKYNVFSSYQRSFLQTWVGKSVPLENAASMLYGELGKYPKEELLLIGESAVAISLETSRSNLASTIVTTLKDMLFELTKNNNSNVTTDFDDYQKPVTNENEIILRVILSQLEPDELEIAEKIMQGENPKLSKALKLKLQNLFKED